MTTHINRRAALAAVAAVTAVPAVGLCKGASGASTEDQVRQLIHKLLSDWNGITAGEWVERKMTVRMLQAIIGDPVTPMEPHELELLAQMRVSRTGLM